MPVARIVKIRQKPPSALGSRNETHDIVLMTIVPMLKEPFIAFLRAFLMF